MTQDEFTVTPYAVQGDVDYDRVLEQFGADDLTEEQRERFPDPVHPLVSRGIFYGGRDVGEYLDAIESDEQVSIVTGRGPSGPMHIGHVFPFYLAKYLQEQTGAYVFIPMSDDEKYFAKDQDFEDLQNWTRQNIEEIMAVGFDPERTRIVVDTADSDVIYPWAAKFAKRYTQSTVDATYGDPENIGLSFYPAVQATHLLLPQLIHGRHRTMVPIAVDQDPHIRLCRDVAAKEDYDVYKPSAMLSRFFPQLKGEGGKMSSSDDAPTIFLSDDRETVRDKIQKYAYSGGQTSIEEHRELGGDPDVDVAYQLLYYFFERDDQKVKELADEYRSGELLTGELKNYAADEVADFLEAHQARKEDLGSFEEELERYSLTDEERDKLTADLLY
jgi:tryptophanyl-tRNA synthetase